MKKLLLLISIFSVSTLSFAETVEQIQIFNGKAQKNLYIIDNKNNIRKCNDGGNCSVFYRADKKYCNNLANIKDDIQAQVRMRWECPRYASINELKEYRVQLTNNPVFSEYTFNLVKIFSNFEYVKKDNKIFFRNIDTTVGISPNNIMIPKDINDIVTDITINLDKENRIISEIYKLKNGELFDRVYIYKGDKIIKIIDTSTNFKSTSAEEYIFSYSK